MSRIGKNPISFPDKVKITVNGSSINVEGPKGKLTKTFDPVVSFKLEGNVLQVEKKSNSRFANAMQGTARSIVAGMVQGVVSGYTKDLEIHGVGFRATLKGKNLDLALGYSHPIVYPIPEGIVVTVTDNTKLKVEGVDKQKVGAVAADIKRFYPPEPYKGKGVRIVGEPLLRKEGKTAS
jgi:large subunit ribosomal protein L6